MRDEDDYRETLCEIRYRHFRKLSCVFGSLSSYSFPDAGIYKTIDGFLILKSDLPLCRMDIEIHLRRINIEEEKEDRMLITGKNAFICIIYCMRNGLVFYRSLVYKDELMGFHVSEIVTF